MPRLEEFDDVQLDVEFTQADSRSNLTSNENIAISFGKISKWYEALVPTGGSSGQFLGWNSSGTAKWVANPNVDTKVTSTLLAQSTAAATYLPTFVSAAGNGGVNIMNSFSFGHTVGTTSAVGNSRIVLGNATASGTANNEEGQIVLYSSGTSYHTIKGSATASTVTHSLPTTGGTILNTGTTSFTQTLTSGTKIGSIKINGTSTDIYCETNTNTDTKVTDTVGTANTYYPAGGTSTSTATGTQVFDISLKFIGTTGTTSAVGKAQLVLGNSTASGTANNKQGSLVVYGSTAYAHTIQGAPTAARTLTLPDKAGTFALTSDIPSVPTVNDAALTLKGAGTTVTTFTANASSAKSLDIVAGSNVTVTADATNSNITIAAKDTVTTVTTSGSGNAVTAITASNGALTVTKGSTFLTSHQSVTDGNPTLSWGNQSTVATIGSTDIHVTMPANPNTDTKVTSSANHYAPATVSGQDKSASATGATAAWSIDVVKGVTLNTDGKGHVTGISVTSGKIPANPVPSNNVTGSGTSGYLTKWNGTNTITNGPQLGSSTTTYLNNAGSWATPPDTKNTAGSTDTSSKIYLIGATSQAANPQTYSDDQCYVTSGTLQANKVQASVTVSANTGNSPTAGGISLYSNDPEVYGIMFRGTSNSGKHGYVQSDWATYFTMNQGATTRGWIFRKKNDGPVASISGAGNAVFDGSVTVGGNSANTSGCRMEYNATTQTLDFVFV